MLSDLRSTEEAVYLSIVDDIFMIVPKSGEHYLADKIKGLFGYVQSKGLRPNNEKISVYCHEATKLLLRQPTLQAIGEMGLFVKTTSFEALGGLVSYEQPSCVEIINQKMKAILEPFSHPEMKNVSLHLQHFLFQSATIPAIEYFLINTPAITDVNLDFFCDALAKWYLAKFGEQTPATLTPLTKALLCSPICAGGGLGIPSSFTIKERRKLLGDKIDSYKSLLPPNHQSHSPLHYPEEQKKSDEARRKASKARTVQYLDDIMVDSLEDPLDKRRWKEHAVRDTRWFKVSPSRKAWLFDDALFKTTISLFTATVRTATIKSCSSTVLPNFKHVNDSISFMDHVLHCAACAGPHLTRRHNAVNDAIRRTLKFHGVHYTMEPKGLFVVDPDQPRIFKHADGPDGLLLTEDGYTVVEIHCTHQKWRNYNATHKHLSDIKYQRMGKQRKYAAFLEINPEISLHLLSFSSFGLLLVGADIIKNKWKPLTDAGFMKDLVTDVLFSANKENAAAILFARITNKNQQPNP
jgi:hypothetical protein